MPGLNKVCDVQLQARTVEPVLLGDGSKRELLRVDQTTVVDGKPAPEFDARVYVDANGQVLKSEQDVFTGIAIFRTTKEGALAPAGPVKFDLILNTVVKVGQRIPNPEQTRHIKYRVTLKDSEPGQVIPSDLRQTVTADETKTRPPWRSRPPAPWTGPRRPRRSPRSSSSPTSWWAAMMLEFGAMRSERRGAWSIPGRRPRGSTIGYSRT